MSSLAILQKYWGHHSFKPFQEEIIESVLNDRDTVALLPTGGGKSVCFQIPALAKEGICIVVSPLVALMGDQVQNLMEKGIKALHISGGISFNDLQTLLDNALYGNYKFLYLSPERLQQEIVQNFIRQMQVNLIAVDEAHCISQWGNDFRPSYKNITMLREMHPLVPIIALTATATPEVLEDTVKELKLEAPAIYKSSFVRENLAYKVYKIEDKLYKTEQLLKHNDGKAIVYVRSRKMAVETSNHLNTLNIVSHFYHGGMSKKEKAETLLKWRNDEVQTIVATNAFGMGIDSPNVRFVIHIQLPDSLESYFQEAGRAGRDGEYAQAILLYNDYDKQLVKKQFVDSLPSSQDLKNLYKKLNSYFQVSYGEGEFTQHNFNFTEFCDTYKLNSLITFNALNALDRLGIIQLSKEFGRRSIVQFVISSEEVLRYFENNGLLSLVGKTILRMYGGIFEMPTATNLELIAKKTGQSVDTIIEQLKKMERDGLLELTLKTTDASITFLKPREDDKTINVVAKEAQQQNEKKTKQVKKVLRYVENNETCKSLQLVRYFGEINEEPCGICSVCIKESKGIQKNEISLIAEKILNLLEEQPQSSRNITEKTTFEEQKVLQVLQKLMNAERIGINPKNQYYIL